MSAPRSLLEKALYKLSKTRYSTIGWLHAFLNRHDIEDDFYEWVDWLVEQEDAKRKKEKEKKR